VHPTLSVALAVGLLATGSCRAGGTGPGEPPYAGHRSEIYDGDANWLCRPGIADDVCSRDLDAIVVRGDGTTGLQRHRVAADPPVDCFYVYPTVSSDPGPNSDLEVAELEEVFAVYDEAARLTGACRVFAPVYRQVTLRALFGTADDPAAGDPWHVAYLDVVDAFRHYMANDNDGRGFVLVGHAQGAAHLRRLVAEEVDDRPAVRSRLVSAIVLGWPVAVPAGEIVGGDFDHVPLCQASDDTGCVVSYSSFRSTDPPPDDSLFGRPMDVFPVPRDTDGEVAACVNPARPEGGRASLRPYLPVGLPEASLAGAVSVRRTPELGAARFVTYPDLVEAECVQENGFSYLSLTMAGDAGDRRGEHIRGGLTPRWGTHLVDVNVGLGDLVALVRDQAESYIG
jgi:hypothetical protein